jgi:two-component system cell cycle sensor histidine kinase/response regulator CckA
MAGVEPRESKGVVLVVDDEPIVLRLASAVLAEAGYRPVVAESAAVGFDRYLELRPDLSLVLLDVVMPGGNGLELAERIRQLDPTLKILVMSGYSDLQLEVQARKRYPFIRKPFLRDDLLKRTAEVLGKA